MKIKKNIPLAMGLLIILVIGLALKSKCQSASLPAQIISIKLDESKVFLIPGKNGYLLFDTGYSWDFKTFAKSLAKKKIPLDSISYLFVSHAHDDHVGFVNELVAVNPSLKVILHEKTVPLILTGKNNKKNGGGLFNRQLATLFKIKQKIKPHWNLTYSPYRVRENDIILKGDMVELPEEVGVEGFVIATPGHTSDSMSLLYKKKFLLCADMASTSFNWLGGKQLTVFNENMDDLYSSWKKIIAMEIPVIVPSHGTPFLSTKLAQHINAVPQEQLVTFF